MANYSDVLVLAQSGAGAGVPLRELALVLFVGCASTYLATGIVRSIMMRFGQVNVPRDRDVHKVPTHHPGYGCGDSRRFHHRGGGRD